MHPVPETTVMYPVMETSSYAKSNSLRPIHSPRDFVLHPVLKTSSHYQVWGFRTIPIPLDFVSRIQFQRLHPVTTSGDFVLYPVPYSIPNTSYWSQPWRFRPDFVPETSSRDQSRRLRPGCTQSPRLHLISNPEGFVLQPVLKTSSCIDPRDFVPEACSPRVFVLYPVPETSFHTRGDFISTQSRGLHPGPHP